VKAGSTVLVQGTGGVSLFALQFAKAAGARVIITSSSDDKLRRAAAMGADVGINYRDRSNWPELVRNATQGNGADIIVETGGATLPQSLDAAGWGGFVAVVGFVAGYSAEVGIRQILAPMLRIQGMAVGSKKSFESMNDAISTHRIRPVVDRTFALEDSAEAFAYLASGSGHFGKVVVEL